MDTSELIGILEGHCRRLDSAIHLPAQGAAWRKVEEVRLGVSRIRTKALLKKDELNTLESIHWGLCVATDQGAMGAAWIRVYDELFKLKQLTCKIFDRVNGEKEE